MASVHGKGGVLLFDEFDLSGYFRSSTINRGVETADDTAYGDSGRSFVPGLKTGTASFEGIWDSATDASDEELNEAFGSATNPIILFAPDTLAVGKPTYVANAIETNYNVSTPVADIVSLTADFQSDGDGVERAISLHALTAETAVSNFASVDNAASSASGGLAQIHATVVTGAGASAIWRVQHSSDNVTFADFIAMATVTAATKERKSATGTVNRYVRGRVDTFLGTSPSETAHLSFVRR